MQVMHDGRMPIEIPTQQVAHGELGVIDVAIVVVEDVFAPVGRAGEAVVLGGLADFVAEIPIDVAVAAIGIGGGSDGDDQVIANAFHDGRVFGDQAVGQLHQHFGRAGFAAVEAGHEMVDGLGFGDDFARLRLR